MSKSWILFQAIVEGCSCDRINALSKEYLLPSFFSYEVPRNGHECECATLLEKLRPNMLTSEETKIVLVNALERGRCGHFETDNTVIRAGITPLHVAVAFGHIHLVEWCLTNAKISPAVQSLLQERTPLHFAARNILDISVACKMASLLLSTNLADRDTIINSKDRLDETALHYSVRNNAVEFVKLLIRNNCDVNVVSNNHETPVYIASSVSESAEAAECLQLLIEAGARVNVASLQSRLLQVPLYAALRNGNLRAMELLTDAGADVNYTARGESLLIQAVVNGHIDAVKLLLAKGANPNVCAREAHTALMIAMYVSEELTQALLSAGANVNAVNNKGYSALHFAAWDGQLKMCGKLVDAGAQPDQQTEDRNTPLSLACHGDSLDVANFLIGCGCNVNNADKDLDTPLLYAAYNGNLSLVNKLLECGADAHAMNVVKATALWNAAYKGHDSVVLRLMRENVPLDIRSKGIDQTAQQLVPQNCYENPVTPLFAALDRNHLHIGKLLVSGGACLAELRYSWFSLGMMPAVLSSDNDAHAWFVKKVTNPRSLLCLSCMSIRNLLGRQLSAKVHELQIPKMLETTLIRGLFDT